MNAAQEKLETWRTIWRYAENLKHFFRPDTRAADVETPFPAANLRQALSGQKAGFVSSELFCHPPLFGYVNGGADKSSELSLAIKRCSSVQNPTIFSARRNRYSSWKGRRA